jgi:hypothetical protein
LGRDKIWKFESRARTSERPRCELIIVFRPSGPTYFLAIGLLLSSLAALGGRPV